MSNIIEFKRMDKDYIDEIIKIFNGLNNDLNGLTLDIDECFSDFILKFKELYKNVLETKNFLTPIKNKKFIEKYNSLDSFDDLESSLFIKLEYILFTNLNSKILSYDKEYLNLILNSYMSGFDEIYLDNETKRILNDINNPILREILKQKNNDVSVMTSILECLHEGYNFSEINSVYNEDRKPYILSGILTIYKVYEYYSNQMYLLLDLNEEALNEALNEDIINNIEKIKTLDCLSEKEKDRFLLAVSRVRSEKLPMIEQLKKIASLSSMFYYTKQKRK